MQGVIQRRSSCELIRPIVFETLDRGSMAFLSISIVVCTLPVFLFLERNESVVVPLINIIVTNLNNPLSTAAIIALAFLHFIKISETIETTSALWR
ncbi:MAG: hypothetical protein S4CHLAM20_01750 [Chlamydiia bacterium]|nr:hypothetical protein [Chlamydiia bacterium]